MNNAKMKHKAFADMVSVHVIEPWWSECLGRPTVADTSVLVFRAGRS
jgi:hypothetical protein